MKDDQGSPLTGAQLLDRVAEIGVLVVIRKAAESKDFATWRRELRRRARARGLRISVLRGDGFVVVHNPDHVVTEQQRRTAFAAMSTGLTDFDALHPAQSHRRRPDLRVAGRPGSSRSRSVPPA